MTREGNKHSKKSAGLLMYRFKEGVPQILLVHPGGPYWSNKDDGAWSIPKGLIDSGENPFSAARREFKEETGIYADGTFIALTPLKQPGGKIIYAWAFKGDCDPATISSNTFPMEWPPRSGIIKEFYEIDRAQWFPIDLAKTKIIKGQRGFIEELERVIQTNDPF